MSDVVARCAAAHPVCMSTSHPRVSHARVPAGIPTGGQFAEARRGEAELRLAEPTVGAGSTGQASAESASEGLDRAAEEYLDTYDAAGASSEHAALQQTIDLAYDSARHWERQKGARDRSRGVIDEDDVAQEALLAVLERQANGHVVDDPKGYMHRCARSVAQRAGNEAVRQENRKALRMFNQASDQRAGELGRRLTRAEEDQIATSIRDSWHDPRHKPSADFRRYAGQMEVSIHASETQDTYLLPNSVLGQPGEENTFEIRPGTFTDRAFDAAEGFDGDLRHAKRLLWNALAEHSEETPLVQQGTLSQRKVTAMRAKMNTQPHGVLGAIDAWENGQHGPATDALFAPWGTDCPPEAQQAVVTQIRRFPERADALWNSAMQLANTRHAA